MNKNLLLFRAVNKRMDESFASYEQVVKAVARSHDIPVDEVHVAYDEMSDLYRTMLVTPIAIYSPTRVVRDEGDSMSFETLVQAPVGTPDIIIQLWADREFPTSHCQHSYDCCGHWYQYSWPTVENTAPIVWSVKHGTSQNV